MPDSAITLLDGIRLVLQAADKGDLTADEALAEVVQELTPAPPVVVIQPAPTLTVADLLAQSRQAHLGYRQAETAKLPTAQRLKIAEAFTLRQRAEALDPEFHDLGWEEPPPFVHATLMPFYREQVGGL